MTAVETLLDEAATILEPVTDAARNEAEALFCFLMHIDKVKLYTKDLTISDKERERLLSLVYKRATGMPLAYIFSSKGFYGRDFKVTPETLIPRPETEMLIDIVKEAASDIGPPSIIDVGTGSGCIAITLALEIPNAQLTATDIDEKALAVAKKNAGQLGATVSFQQNDLLKSVEDNFDIVVANLPYVLETDKDKLKQKSSIGLQFEPHHALYAGKDGLDMYRRLLTQIETIRPAYVILEIDPRQTEALQKLIITSLSVQKIEIIKDLADFDRVLKISL